MTQPLDSVTPLIKQYRIIKEQYSDTLVFFQVGDFYELFFDDAKKAAAFLGITLTTRGKNNHGDPIPLCGVPVHALDYYLVKLVRGGFRVAICDQLEEPQPGKVVKRGVTKVLTPGTLTDEKLLDEKSASYLLSFFPMENSCGLLFGELLTAQLFATTISFDAMRMLESELVRFFPDEILMPEVQESQNFKKFFSQLGFCTTMHYFDQTSNEPEQAWLGKNFQSSIQAVISKHQALQYALYNFYWYLKKNQQQALEYFKQIHFYQPDDFLMLDAATQRNLELVQNNQDGKRTNTLFSLVDKAITAMGSRCIKKWLVRPLLKKDLIIQRQEIVELFFQKPVLLQRLQELLRSVGDLERIIGRIALNRASVYDYVLLSKALEVLPEVAELCANYVQFSLINIVVSFVASFKPLYALLTAALDDEISQQRIIKNGFDQHLDQLRMLAGNSHQAILDLEQQEQERTRINSLKIRYNQVYGYYIEITKPNLALVPQDYIRMQTLVGKERFTTVALKKLESEITAARFDVERVEKEIYERIQKEVAVHISSLRKLAQALAHLDALMSFGALAADKKYVRPVFNETKTIAIKEGRHPVVDSKLENRFIANDLFMDDAQRLLIITGPNMGGKSTYLRQGALISILAQCGAFVPAQSANLPILDRIFTRIGAGDNVAEGKSTFFVEMEETALICNQATENSLVILDEVGRGTSTFDGLAIAQAVVEYLYSQVKARCLFATHYHELTALENQCPGIASFHAASKKTEKGILFLYKILRGAADGSFGLEVARLAALPESVIKRAQEILQTLTAQGSQHQNPNTVVQGAISTDMLVLQKTIDDLYLQLRQKENLSSELKNLNFEELSPKMAFDILWKLKEKI
jgi:DNA mismatch repair protein MutS